MKNRIIGFMLFMLTTSGILAQPAQKKYTELRAGDPMVDYTFRNLINYPKSTAKVSDFKDKLLILDFWSTGCSSCINMWPKVLKLQEEFKGKVQFILMNPWENEDVVRKTFARRKQLAGVEMNLPASHSDRTLEEMFPIRGLPHIVWIYKGKVMSRTSSDLTPKNIQDVLDGKKVHMVQSLSSADNIGLNVREPLFINNNTGNTTGEKINVITQSIFTKNSNNLDATSGCSWSCGIEEGYYITATNSDIKTLYRFAYGENQYNEWDGYKLSHEYVRGDRIILDVANKEFYEGKKYGQEDITARFIYQLITPATTIDKLMNRMQMDLAHNVGLTATWEKRMMKCLVLSATDTLLASWKDGEKIEGMGYKGNYEFRINKISTGRLLDRIGSSEYTLLDETGMKGYIGGIYEKDVNPDDPAQVDKALSRHGLRFTLQDRMLDVLVLREPAGFISPLAPKPPVPGTAKPQNVQVIRRPGTGTAMFDVKFDKIRDAVKYRREYRMEDEEEWKIFYTNFNFSYVPASKPGKYIVRVAGISKYDELNTDFDNTSKLNYSDEIAVVVK